MQFISISSTLPKKRQLLINMSIKYVQNVKYQNHT